jgi:hypothetical protein
MTTNILARLLSEQTFDIRISGNGRWIDQKCALDAVCFVADCIVTHVQNGGKQPFQSPDIWHSEYAKENVQHIFGKPDPTIRSTLDEYNKFYRQPMKMLAAAGILKEEGVVRNTIQFSIAQMEVLEYIAQRERNSFDFLCLYIEKTLRDSGLWFSFEAFFELETQEVLDDMKKKFSDFCIKHTPINTAREANRIFIKVLNPLACKFKKRGTERGRLSKLIITYDKIMYNQTNWRDDHAGKNKNVARGDYITSPANDDMYEYRIRRAEKYLRQYNSKYNGSRSEVVDDLSRGSKATHIHHIFPRSQFREIADFIENLIALTSGQHLQRAHPDGNTSVINRDYQYVCLISKANSIKRNIMENQGETIIYKYEDFMHVLDIGLSTDYFSDLHDCDFNSVLTGIDKYY